MYDAKETMINYTKCKEEDHTWKNDPDFEDGIVMMDFDDESEMRQYCEGCGKVRYVVK